MPSSLALSIAVGLAILAVTDSALCPPSRSNVSGSDLIDKIVARLDVTDQVNLASTCRYFHDSLSPALLSLVRVTDQPRSESFGALATYPLAKFAFPCFTAAEIVSIYDRVCLANRVVSRVNSQPLPADPGIVVRLSTRIRHY
jgi:hypothetical protein